MRRTQLTQPETLFDNDTFDSVSSDTAEDILDKKLDHIVDTRGVSYDQARFILGIESPQYNLPEIKTVEPSDGVSVELGARALALHNVMATYNQLNKAMGANITSYYPDNDIDTRYSQPDAVREGMGKKAARMIHDNKKDLQVLNATGELVEAGYNSKNAETQERKIGKDLLDRYGPGKAYAPDRNKVAQRAQRAANMVNRAVNNNKTT